MTTTPTIIKALLIALLMQHRILKGLQDVRSEDFLRAYSLTLIVVGTMLFVTAAFDTKQIAPAFGLFGTIAGYLLGTSSRRKPSNVSKQEE